MIKIGAKNHNTTNCQIKARIAATYTILYYSGYTFEEIYTEQTQFFNQYSTESPEYHACPPHTYLAEHKSVALSDTHASGRPLQC